MIEDILVFTAGFCVGLIVMLGILFFFDPSDIPIQKLEKQAIEQGYARYVVSSDKTIQFQWITNSVRSLSNAANTA